MKRMTVAFCSALMITIGGCGGGGDSSRVETPAPSLTQGAIGGQAAINTGIEGVVMATIPEMVPGSIRFHREPLQGAVLAITREIDNHVVGRVMSDGAGRFSAELPAGRFLLAPQNFKQGTDILRASTQSIPIVPGQISRLTVEYESTSI